MIGGIAKRPTRLKKMNNCPTESKYLYPRHTDANRHNDTEERPTLFFSCLNNLAIFLPEKESNAFQSINGISLPLTLAKLRFYFGLDVQSWHLFNDYI